MIKTSWSWLSVFLLFTDSDYPFGFFKLFLLFMFDYRKHSFTYTFKY